ncbi:hypothetical protein SRS16CHR_03048 [Variovorax sp. SRS16]|uniref:hypothetical protein n=1 Tax=Variovorax sp. SRS16 TaxID=282217 RepID=UPI0013174667|nr:hypothetical protein [Variovorax sp. SRS16]VTU22424.1 hypothetical protein SRS16CHR_03048 [Variovorax sp. SRS16]
MPNNVYNTTAQSIGMIGENAVASGFQIGNSGAETKTLLNELEMLRATLSKMACTPEHEVAVGQVALAQDAAKEGNWKSAVDYLRKSGSWVADVATKIGVSVVADMIKKTTGL